MPGLDPVRAASVSLCDSAELSGNGGHEMYGPEGRRVTLAVFDAAVPADCVAVELPVPAAAVRWFTLSDLPPSARPERLALQGYFAGADVAVSEVIHAQAEVQAEQGFLSFNSDIWPQLHARSFGLEERAGSDGRRVDCAAGTQIAGLTLHSDLLWEHLPGMQLEISATGSGEFAFAIADAAREAQELPLHLGTVTPGGDTVTVKFELPENAQRWTSLVLFCPQAAASLVLDSVKLVPQERAVTAGRATWLWSPDLWRNAPATAWQIAEQENLRRIYITVPLAGAAEVADGELLAAFIRAARARGLEVWAVAGDRGDVLPEQLPPLLARATAYRRFNAQHPDARLGGLQLDIEPYLLPGSSLAPDYWRERYVTTIGAVHAALAGALPLDLVMPVWWGTHPAWGARLLDALVFPELSLTVMNYRTNVDALRAGAMPFLAWGQAHRRKVAMALETGRIGVNAGNGRDETRIDYARAASGELLLMELGGISALLLLDASYAGLPGQAYAKSGERVIGIGSVSFAGEPDRLQAVAAQLEREWSAWDAFAGLALHGLDQ